MRNLTLIIAIATLAFSNACHAAPSVFVNPEGGLAWWIAPHIIRPLSNSIGDHTIENINKFRDRNTSVEAYCFIEKLTHASVVSADRFTQIEIDRTLASQISSPFELEFSPDPSVFLKSIVGVFQTCDGSTGSFVLTIDRSTNQIVDVNESDGHLFFLYPIDQSVGARSCFSCGERNSLFYDVSRKKVYWESVGD